MKIEISETLIVFPDFSVFSAYSAGSISSTDSGRSSFIDIHCFFRSVTNLNSCSGCSSPLPPPQSFGAGPPPGALVAPANYFRGDVLRYWGGVTSIVLKCFPHLSHLKFAWGPCQVSASPTHVMVIPFRRVCVVALITLEFFQISVSLGSFDNLVASSASSAKVELEKISSPSSSAFWGRPPPGALVAPAN